MLFTASLSLHFGMNSSYILALVTRTRGVDRIRGGCSVFLKVSTNSSAVSGRPPSVATAAAFSSDGIGDMMRGAGDASTTSLSNGVQSHPDLGELGSEVEPSESMAWSTRVSFSARKVLAAVWLSATARGDTTGHAKVSHAHSLPQFPSLYPRLEPLTVAPAQARRSTAALEAGVDPIVVAVITISIIIPVAIELVIGGRRQRMPVLEFDQSNPNQISKCRYLGVYNVVRPEEERRPAVMLLLWLRDRHDDLVGHQVWVGAPRRDEQFTLNIQIRERVRVRELDLRTSRAEPRKVCATTSERACDRRPLSPTSTRYRKPSEKPMMSLIHANGGRRALRPVADCRGPGANRLGA